MPYKVFAINPGSTSTKVALFEMDRPIFSANVTHDAAKLAEFDSISDQLAYREETILSLLEEKQISLKNVDAFVGRGGGLLPLAGGTYEIDDVLLDHARRGANGVEHPAQLGSQLAWIFQQRHGGKGLVVNPPDVDEIQDVARMTGIKGVYRTVHLHALNLKETAIRHAALANKAYEDCRLIVCHIGGGISISAHDKGRMIDGFDIVGGEGAMAPTRCGSIPVAGLLQHMTARTPEEMRGLCTRSGGFVSHLGISDALEVYTRGQAGDAYAAMLWNAMLYQIEKCIGAMAAVLHGNVEGILLGGGMVYNEDLVHQIKTACEWIAPVTAYPGEFEMEAMAAGAVRVLTGKEAARRYSGEPVWKGFDFEKSDKTE